LAFKEPRRPIYGNTRQDSGNGSDLDVFAVSCMMLTHPQRLSRENAHMIDCGGEYSFCGDLSFDRVPPFDYNTSGIEFSIFCEDRARDL
jgi:hypothetical protein